MDKKTVKISDEMTEEIKTWLLQEIAAAKNARDIRESDNRERDSIYFASPDYYDKMFPVLAETSHQTDSSLALAVERRLASICKMFFGGQSVGKITASDPSMDESADKMDQLINYQLERKNTFFERGYQWMKDTDIHLLGVVKSTWYQESEKAELNLVLDQNGIQQVSEAGTDAKVIHAEFNGHTNPANGLPLFDVVVSYTKITECYPEVLNVPSNEFIYSPNARDVDEARMVGHVLKMTTSDLKERSDIYDVMAIDRATEPYTTDQSERNREETPGVETNRKDEREVVEVYFKYDVDGDGVYEYLTATLCGTVFLRKPLMNPDVYNQKLTKPAVKQWQPFHTLASAPDPHRIWPRTGMIDRAGQIQHLIVATMRGIQTSLALGNNPQAFINENCFMDIDEILEGCKVVRLNDDPSKALQWRVPPPIQPFTLNFIELLKGKVEEITGVSRINQGVSQANSLNKTATGMNAIVEMGNQTIEFSVRRYAETGYKSLIERFIFLNQVYGQGVTIRGTMGQVVIGDQDLAGDYMYQTDVGIGAGTREQNLQLLQQLKAEAPTLIQAGLMNMSGAYNLTKKSYEEAGLKNIQDYLLDPAQQPPKQAPTPNAYEQIKVDFTSLPVNAKVQLLQMIGLQVTPQDFENDMLMQQQMQNMAARTDVQANALKEQQRAGADIAKIHAQEHAKAAHATASHHHELRMSNVEHQQGARLALIQHQQNLQQSAMQAQQAQQAERQALINGQIGQNQAAGGANQNGGVG